MVTQLLSQFSGQVQQVLTWLKGFEESGYVAIDSVSLYTRNSIREYGII